MPSRPAAALAALLSLAAVPTAGCAAPSDGAPAHVRVLRDNHGYRGTWLDPAYAKPAQTFTDTAGRPYVIARDATAPVTVVFFGYTHCPDVCSAVLADVASARRRLEPAVKDKVGLVFITTDPARDTPDVIRRYLERFDPSFVGLTGPPATIERAADQLDVALGGTSRLPGGGYEVGHGAQLLGFGPDGQGRLLWTEGTPVADLRHDLARLAAGAR